MKYFFVVATTILLYQYVDALPHLTTDEEPFDPLPSSEEPAPPYVHPPAYTPPAPSSPAAPVTPPVPSTPPPAYSAPATPVVPAANDTTAPAVVMPIDESSAAADNTAPEVTENSVVFNPSANLPQVNLTPFDLVSKFDGILQDLEQIGTVPEAYFEDILVNNLLDTKEEIMKQITNQAEVMKDVISKQNDLSPQKKDELLTDYQKVIKDARDKIEGVASENTQTALEIFESLEIAKVASDLAAKIREIKQHQLDVATHLVQIPGAVRNIIIQATEPIKEITQKYEREFHLIPVQ